MRYDGTLEFISDDCDIFGLLGLYSDNYRSYMLLNSYSVQKVD